jgi:hypothetical protein
MGLIVAKPVKIETPDLLVCWLKQDVNIGILQVQFEATEVPPYMQAQAQRR